MSETTSILEQRLKLHQAASYQSREENPERDDIMYRSFVKLMLHRREVAIRMIGTQDENVYKELEDIYEHCNKLIKDILAL